MAYKYIRACGCKNCLHASKDINLETDEFEQNGNRYWHKDCYEAKENVEKIKAIWEEKIDEFVVWSQLVSKLRKLIFEQKKDSNYILFAIGYAADHPNVYKLHNPYGINYILGRKEIQEEYKKSKIKNVKDSDFKLEKPTQNNSPKFTVKQNKQGFGGIFGGSY